MKKIVVILSIISLMLVLIFFNQSKDMEYFNELSIEYFEDVSGEMDFDQVINSFDEGLAKENNNENFVFGRSTSTYWIKIKNYNEDFYYHKNIISIYNPTVSETILFLPRSDGSYDEKHSGWKNGHLREDEGFFYPTYKLIGKEKNNFPIYLKLRSRFTQNYRITFLSEKEFDEVRRGYILFYGLIFGTLLGLIIQSFVVYIGLKQKHSLYFILYILSMMIYQGNLCGIYNSFFPDSSYYIMENTIVFSLLGMTTIIMFFREFFNTKVRYSSLDPVLNWILIAIVITGVLSLSGQHKIANMSAHIISNLGSIVLLLLAYMSYRSGEEKAKLFLWGWIFMVFGLILSIFRHIGLISNNIMTIHIIFITIAIQALLMSTNIIREYKVVEEDAESYEFAFLHAQIKPHFLYNSLNVISSLCRINPEKAREMILDLSDYMRYLFDTSKDNKIITLSQELECVKAYVRIEQSRFVDKLDVEYLIGNKKNFRIPSLTIQPIVENAIVHGIRKKKEMGKIIVIVEEKEEFYNILVSDNGIGIDESEVEKLLKDNWEKGSSIGINNVNNRLIKYYGEGINIKSSIGEGTVVSFKIPREENL
jgi:sensor histidine kinase YesM